MDDEWYTLHLQYDSVSGRMICRAEVPSDPALSAEVSVAADFVNDYPGNHTEGVGLTTSMKNSGSVNLDWFSLVADRASV